MTIDLTDFLFSETLHRTATGALESIGNASTLAEIKQCLANGEALLNELDERHGDPLDLKIARKILVDQADIRHGAVWPK